MISAAIFILFVGQLPIPSIFKTAIDAFALALYLRWMWRIIQSSRNNSKGNKIFLLLTALYYFLGCCILVSRLELSPKKVPVELVAAAEPTADTPHYYYPYSVHAHEEDLGGLNRLPENLSSEVREILADADFEHYSYIVTYGCTMPSELSFSVWDSFRLPFSPLRRYGIPPGQAISVPEDTVYVWRTAYLCYEFS